MTGRARAEWLVPAALVALVAVPLLGGALRVAELSGLPAPTPSDPRFTAAPAPVVVHIVAAGVYIVLGAFQFAPGLRRTGWHRAAGRVLVPVGLAVALSALVLTLLHPRAPDDGDLLAVFRTAAASGMAVAIVLGVRAMRRRDFDAHGAWMTRAYAIGAAAGTQFLITVAWTVLVGEPDPSTRALLMGACWVVNLAVAEAILRRASGRRSAPRAGRSGAAGPVQISEVLERTSVGDRPAEDLAGRSGSSPGSSS